MKEDITISVIVPNHNYLQICTHGCHYTCFTKEVEGESYFHFKGKWHRTADYITDTTFVNTGI